MLGGFGEQSCLLWLALDLNRVKLSWAALTYDPTVSQEGMFTRPQAGTAALIAAGTVALVQISLYGQQDSLNKIIV